MSRPGPFRSILALALVAVGLVGCSKDEPPPSNLPAGTALMAESATAMRNVKFAHVRIVVEGEISALPLRRAEGDLINTGDAKGNIQLKQGETLIQYDFVVLGQTIYLKGATGGWNPLPASVASTIYDPSAIMDPERGIPKLLATATNATTEAEEKVDGKDAYRVAASLDRAAVGALVPGVTSGATGKLWLDKNTKHLLKAVLTVPGTSNNPPGTVTVDLSAIDVPVTVSAP
jgi:lipoprotein LprG